MLSGYMKAKLDSLTAFHSLRRDVILEIVFGFVPNASLHTTRIRNLFSGIISHDQKRGVNRVILSVLFSQTIQPLIATQSSEPVVGYLDDITDGGPESIVSGDIELHPGRGDSATTTTTTTTIIIMMRMMMTEMTRAQKFKRPELKMEIHTT